MLKVFNGQYKNEKTLIKFNLVRYTTMCIVLDYYCFMNSVDSDIACSIDHLEELVFNKSSFDDTEENRTMVQTTIVNMKMMGLLFEPRLDYLAITDQGKVDSAGSAFLLNSSDVKSTEWKNPKKVEIHLMIALFHFVGVFRHRL